MKNNTFDVASCLKYNKKNENPIKVKKKYRLKIERAIRCYTRKHMQENVD